MEADFSGYATKNDLLCSDGRTILAGAFQHADGATVPLVWQHQHNEPTNVLGHVKLENRDDGVYAYGFFNKTPNAEAMRESVQHGDITAMSIYANGLVHQGKAVTHGEIREVSLVLAGANPGAFIENVRLVHGASSEILDDEAVIFTDEVLEHAEEVDVSGGADGSSEDNETIGDILDTLSDKQKAVVEHLLNEALDTDADDIVDEDPAGDDSDDTDIQHSQGGTTVTSTNRNVFDQNNKVDAIAASLTHDQMVAIRDDAIKTGSFKESFLAHAVEYGIENIDLLFPDAQAIRNSPDFVSRRMEWVSRVLSGTNHSPFSRIKSLSADITHEEARARGYIKGNLKKEEFFGLSKRITTPTTIYKKQKLDRDDIIDVTTIDVVVWLKAEMRLMLDEEIARAILIGDGRASDSDDKIKDPRGSNEGAGIRAIATDNDFYAHQVVVPSNISGDALVETVLRARKHYKGSGNPVFFTTADVVTDLLLIKDKLQRRLYATEEELRTALRVSAIVEVEVMETEPDLVGIMVNLSDYTVGADKGGAIAMFDDFDIDYNQNKYLIETRISGALTKPKSAIVIRRTPGESVTPATPDYDAADGVVTVTPATGVGFRVDGVELTTTTYTVAKGDSVLVETYPKVGYFFPAGTTTSWVFSRPAA